MGRNTRINLWKESDDQWAILKNGDELLYEANEVVQQLIDSVLNDLQNDSFDELINWLEGSTTEELNIFIKHFKDDRLKRCTEIVLSKR
tara:strand:+ start:727 stop:993 length:267 start_codon:yes stop_codon:yes gene_type:complete